MATYKEIFGTNIEVLASDPANPVTGQVWYNSTDNVVKGAAATTVGSWATGGTVGTARDGAGSAGTQTSALFVSGRIGPAGVPPGITTNTELYNGSTWTEVNNLTAGRWQMTGLGANNTAALAFGGQLAPVPSGSKTANNESWNGTSWTEVNNLNTAKTVTVGIGTLTSGLTAGGNSTGNVTETESWNGTSWTEVNDLNTARQGLGGAGADNTSGVVFGGQTPTLTQTGVTESWNGTSWTEVTDLNSARRFISGAGTQTSAVAFGGRDYSPAGSGKTEIWNGTSWTEDTDMSTDRFSSGRAGSNSTSALAISGDTPPRDFTTATEEWTGAGSPLTVTFTDS